MIRASLSSDRHRLCNRSSSCCKGLVNKSCGRQPKKRLPIPQNNGYHSVSRHTTLSRRINQRSSYVFRNPLTTHHEHKSQKFYMGKIFFSTNPSFDMIEEDDENDIDDGEEVRWIKRSSGMDNLSYYDDEIPLMNLLNKEDQHVPYPRQASFDNERNTQTRQLNDARGNEESLMDLLHKNIGLSVQPPEYSQSSQMHHINGTYEGNSHQFLEDKYVEEDSLLELLNTKDEGKPSSRFSYNNGEAQLEQQTYQNNQELTQDSSSLLNLLGAQSSSSPSFPSLNGEHLQFQYQHSYNEIVENVIEPEESLYELLDDTTKNIDTDTKNNAKYKELYRQQLKLELESTEEAMSKILNVWESARDRDDYETLPVVRRTVDSWYGPLAEAIEMEQWLYLNNDASTCTFKHSFVDGINDNEEVGEEDQSSNNDEPQRKVRDRTQYGKLLCLLPPRKIAVILAHCALQTSLSDREGRTKVVSLAMNIAHALETEVNVSRALRVRAKERKMKLSEILNEDGDGEGDSSAIANPKFDTVGGISEQEADNIVENKLPGGEDIAIDNWTYTATHLQRFIDELSSGGKSGDQTTSLQGLGKIRPETVRRRCKEILLAEGFVPQDGSEPNMRQLSMDDFVDWDPVQKVKLGSALIRLLLDCTLFSGRRQKKGHANPSPEPAFQYVKKTSANGKSYGYVAIHPDLHNIAVHDEFTSTTEFISPSNNINTRVQPMLIPPNEWTHPNNGGYEMIKVPFMRTRHCKTQKDSIYRADLSKVMEGLNVLGRIPWKINRKVLDIAWKCWDDGIVLGDIPAQTDYEVPPLPPKMEYKDYKTLGDLEREDELVAYRKYRERVSKHNRFKQKNMDLHSLRCSAMLKLNQAKKFEDFDEIFFPYNVDFRGRAYPVPPHLSIVGSDLCRALLMFADPKPLGKNGLYWLKVHLANLAGADKMSFDGRAQFADDNMDNIRAAVDDPFGENEWWREFDDPFQGIATCHEIVKAIDSGDPENYMCNLPVHMDGSCNGLQHYAALGLDKGGGKAVNLCVADKPQDVYIGVMHEVVKRVAADADEMVPFDEDKSDLTSEEKELLKKIKSARLVNGLIDRGVVKRTVMTSVYGVTYIGAKNQISEKIEEKLEAKGYDIHEKEPEIHTACGYLAKLTMEVMGEQFKGARQTMNWLTDCARLIAAQGQPVSFISPIGVPVVQPYRQRRPFQVVTLLQNITLTNDSDVLPLHRTRQVSAFPPNYVHSLDSSHMLLTAIEMEKRGLNFSAVHDSYWTHPCDIEEMNSVLRESFIDLYTQPLLEQLRQTWQRRYPTVEFPEIPAKGDLDLNDVRSAPYFFQ